MKIHHTIGDLCVAFGVSASGYHAHCHRQANPSPRALGDAQLSAKITAAYLQSRGTYGAPRIQQILRNPGQPTPSRKRIARLMKQQRQSARPRRRYKVRTTDSNHDGPIAPNLLSGRPAVTAIDHVWRSDLTYVETGEGWLYLCAFKDACSRRLVGWAMSEKIDTHLVLSALEMARRIRQPEAGLIIHTDRGCQYSSQAYRQKLHAMGAIPSMSRRGNCYDNAAMESAWSTLKLECVYRRSFTTHAEARAHLHDYICFYNRERLHSSLGYLSPLDYESLHH
jgi:putative transposase